jgi:hypothetical protein
MRRLRRADGKVNFFSILLLVVVAAGIYLGVMLVPPYMDHYKFEEKLKAVSNMAHRQKDDEVLMREIKRECENLEMSLPAEAIQIERDPEQGRWIRISARYVREVEMVPFGKVVTLEFSSDLLERLDK